MSTPTRGRHATEARTAAVPQPRPPADPLLGDQAGRRPGTRPTPPSPPPGVFERRPWLIPASGIASVVAAFVSMVVLNWAAGGGTPFDR